MPSKYCKMRLSETQDRRRKLTEAQKDEIRELYAKGAGSQKALADMYDVSKSCIGIIVNPKRAEAVSNRIKEHWQDYANREQLTKAARNLRHYKRQLYMEGKLK